jgi:hypothetical protein
VELSARIHPSTSSRRGAVMKIIFRAIMCALLLMMGSVSTAAATPGQPDLQVPIKGYVVGLDEEPDEGATGCEVAGAHLLWRFTGSGTGRVAHLGRVTYHFTHCTHVDYTIVEGVMTLIAANGDSLELTYTGTITQYTPGDEYALWEMAWTVDGGTGRFVDATGSGDGDAVTYAPPYPDPHTELSLSGTIGYDASSRSVA